MYVLTPELHLYDTLASSRMNCLIKGGVVELECL
jgi:hypothetical protein